MRIAQHTVRVDSINDVARCRACQQPLLHVEDDLQWAHASGPADHLAEVEFEITARDRRPTYECGDLFVIEAPEGSWLGEAYDTSTQGWTAFVEAT